MNRIFFLLIIVICFSCQSKDKEQKAENTVMNEQEKKVNDVKEKFILFFGNSLTAGYGLEEGQSFPDLIQNRLDSLGYSYKVINAGLSGETSSGGDNRIDWVLNQPMDIFVLELGANDMLRGLDVNSTHEHLESILNKVRMAKGDIPIIIAGMQAPPNLGRAYSGEFADIFTTLAKKYNATLIPFFLEGVAAIPKLNQRDGIHPNVKGTQIVTNTVWEYLVPKMKK